MLRAVAFIPVNLSVKMYTLISYLPYIFIFRWKVNVKENHQHFYTIMNKCLWAYRYIPSKRIYKRIAIGRLIENNFGFLGQSLFRLTEGSLSDSELP